MVKKNKKDMLQKKLVKKKTYLRPLLTETRKRVVKRTSKISWSRRLRRY